MEPFLNAHRINTDNREFEEVWRHQILYDISGIFSPIAIRDQIIRASLVIERAIEEEIINSSNRPLLIIGGGFAGITAAYHAVRKNIPTYLVEKDKVLDKFNSLDRYVCPTLYDFPLSHWNKKEFPLEDESSIKVKIEAGEIEIVRENFNKYFVELKNNTLFNFLQFAEISEIAINQKCAESVDIPLPKSFVTASVKIKESTTESEKNFSPPVSEFGMILSCIGFAKEQTWVRSQKGFNGAAFWEINFEDYNSGNTKTLICGSGDGALQDFLLIISEENSAREIYKRLGLSGEVREWIEQNLYRAEDDAYRSTLWHGKQGRRGHEEDRGKYSYINKKLREHNTLYNLQQKYLAVVEKLLKPDSPKTNPVTEKHLLPSDIKVSEKDAVSLRVNLEEMIGPFFSNENEINIAFACNHFSRNYSLNRFLSLLFIEYIEQILREKVLLQNTAITDVLGADHSCEDCENFECIEKEHDVLGNESKCAETSENIAVVGRYNRVIIRFGLERLDSPFEKLTSPYKNCRVQLTGLQILPYSFPEF